MLRELPQKRAIGLFHWQVKINLEPSPSGGHMLVCDRIVPFLFKKLPIQAAATLLPVGEIVEVDTMFKQQFVFVRDGELVQRISGRTNALPFLPQQPVAMTV